MPYLKNKITNIKNIFGIYTESISYPYLKIIALVLVGISIVLFESIGLSMLIPILQKVVDGVDNKIIIPIVWLNPLENWLNKWNGYEQLIILSSLIFFSGFCRAIFTIIKNLSHDYIALKIGNYWREKIFNAILFASIIKTCKYKFGYLQNLIVVECGNMRFLYRGMLQFFTAVVMCIFYVIILLTISVKLTFITTFLLLICSLPVYTLIKYIRHTSFSRAESRSFLGSIIIETLSSLKSIHLLKTFDFETSRFKHSIDDVLDKEFKMLKRNVLVNPINQTIALIIPLLILFLGLRLTSNSDVRPLWIIAFIAIFVRLAPISHTISTAVSIISKVYGSIVLVNKSIEKFNRYELKNGQIKVDKVPEKIIFKKVGFCYDESIPALKDINITIDKGSHIAFVGPSGSGKSTLIGLIARLYDPDEGDIFLNSVSLREIDIYSWRNYVGIVEQNAVLFNESVKYNISYGLEGFSQEDIINSAKMANAHDFIVKLPQGYDTYVGTMGNAISSGQRQRIAIARSLIRTPDIIILDEATSSVDLESEELINDTINRLKEQGKTIINISHRLSFIKDADKLYFIDNGMIKGSGTFRELMSKNKTFCNYMRLQNLDV